MNHCYEQLYAMNHHKMQRLGSYFALRCEILAGLSRGIPSLFHVVLDVMAQLGAVGSTSKMAHSDGR